MVIGSIWLVVAEVVVVECVFADEAAPPSICDSLCKVCVHAHACVGCMQFGYFSGQLGDGATMYLGGCLWPKMPAIVIPVCRASFTDALTHFFRLQVN